MCTIMACPLLSTVNQAILLELIPFILLLYISQIEYCLMIFVVIIFIFLKSFIKPNQYNSATCRHVRYILTKTLFCLLYSIDGGTGLAVSG